MGNCRWLKISDDLEVIRPQALGRFRDLVRSTATSPAMLIYLDGHDNKVGPPRKTSRSGTVHGSSLTYTPSSVDGGYTQRDVLEAARCMSGWTYGHSFMRAGVSRVGFDSGRHDDGDFEVLGVKMPCWRGEERSGAIDRHCLRSPVALRDTWPTAWLVFSSPTLHRTMSSKRSPPPTESSGGDIPEMVETVFGLPAFRENTGTLFQATVAGTKSPFSGKRLPIPKADRPSRNRLRRMVKPIFEYPTPDGYPLEAEKWFCSLLWRWNFWLDALGRSDSPERPSKGTSSCDASGRCDQLLAH